jgi:hypothetical protein
MTTAISTAASQPHGYYAINVKPLRRLQGMMQATGAAGNAAE